MDSLYLQTGSLAVWILDDIIPLIWKDFVINQLCESEDNMGA